MIVVQNTYIKRGLVFALMFVDDTQAEVDLVGFFKIFKESIITSYPTPELSYLDQL